MHRTSRSTAMLALIALVVPGLLPALATTTATIEGTVQIPCDPSMVGEVVSVQVRPVGGGSVTTIPVDPSSGTFRSPELTEGEYELLALGADGEPLTPEPKKLLLGAGVNQILVSLRPPGCVEQGADPAGGRKKKFYKNKKGPKDWKLTLLYVGAITAIVLAVDNEASDEESASPSQP